MDDVEAACVLGDNEFLFSLKTSKYLALFNALFIQQTLISFLITATVCFSDSVILRLKNVYLETS